MTEKYTGDDRRYTSDEVDILYNVKRCIHAAHCVNRLAEVFDRQKRPWINPSNASPERIIPIVEQCPSGALHYDLKNGVQEAIPTTNTITLQSDGPLHLRGNLSIQGETVALEQETRAILCRCGASKNKPFCDNSHHDLAFHTDEPQPIEATPQTTGGRLTVQAETDGPLRLTGNLEIRNEVGAILFQGDQVALCRCGSSARKPFCDGTHRTIHFQAE